MINNQLLMNLARYVFFVEDITERALVTGASAIYRRIAINIESLQGVGVSRVA
jgi:hypothetical protein